jgi:hypothetical protein
MTNDEPPITPARAPPACHAGSAVARHLPLLAFSNCCGANTNHCAHGTNTWVPLSWVCRSVGWVYFASVPSPCDRTVSSHVRVLRYGSESIVSLPSASTIAPPCWFANMSIHNCARNWSFSRWIGLALGNFSRTVRAAPSRSSYVASFAGSTPAWLTMSSR